MPLYISDESFVNKYYFLNISLRTLQQDRLKTYFDMDEVRHTNRVAISQYFEIGDNFKTCCR
jgi:hypothetical protein